MIFVIPVRGYRVSAYDLPSFSSISGVRKVIPLIIGSAVISVSDKFMSVQVVGIDSDSLQEVFPGLKLADGTLPGKYDYVSLLLGVNVANPIEEEGEDEVQPLMVGQTVSVTFRRLRAKPYVASMVVMGILESYGAIMPFSIDDSVVISLEAADSMFNKRHYYDALILVAEDVSLVDQVIEHVTDLYGQRVRVIAPSQMIETMTNISSQISSFLGLIATVSLVVAGIGIANIYNVYFGY